MLAPTTGSSAAKFDLKTALRGARALLANPDDLPLVFTILEATAGATLERTARRLRASARGRALLAERPEIVSLLDDREALRRMPEGSLGRAYLAFVEKEGISASGITEASVQGTQHKHDLPADEEWVRTRLRDTHDLWHVITGYGGDILGEVALLAFTFAQTQNPGVLLIASLGLFKTKNDPRARAVILDGYRRGRAAAWLVEQPWEWLLEEQLSSVRERLNVGRAPEYRALRVGDLAAPMAA